MMRGNSILPLVALVATVAGDAGNVASASDALRTLVASAGDEVPLVLPNVSGHCGMAYLQSVPSLMEKRAKLNAELAIILLPEEDGDPISAGLYAEMKKIAATHPEGRAIIIAPYFLNISARPPAGVSEPLVHWNTEQPDHKWTAGWDSVTKGDECGEHHPKAVSSFQVLDTFLGMFANATLYPKLTAVAFVGHAGGAEAVQRYLFASQMARTFKPNKGGAASVRGVSLNSMSYLYLDAQRKNVTTRKWGPGNATDCPTFNSWDLGVEGPGPEYVQAVNRTGPGPLISSFLNTNVTYFVGNLDNCTNSTAPGCKGSYPEEVSCGIGLQGPSRLMRGEIYAESIKKLAAQGNAQNFTDVQNVGHDATKMLSAPQVVKAIYNPSEHPGPAPPPGPPPSPPPNPAPPPSPPPSPPPNPAPPPSPSPPPNPKPPPSPPTPPTPPKPTPTPGQSKRAIHEALDSMYVVGILSGGFVSMIVVLAACKKIGSSPPSEVVRTGPVEYSGF